MAWGQGKRSLETYEVLFCTCVLLVFLLFVNGFVFCFRLMVMTFLVCLFRDRPAPQAAMKRPAAAVDAPAKRPPAVAAKSSSSSAPAARATPVAAAASDSDLPPEW